MLWLNRWVMMVEPNQRWMVELTIIVAVFWLCVYALYWIMYTDFTAGEWVPRIFFRKIHPHRIRRENKVERQQREAQEQKTIIDDLENAIKIAQLKSRDHEPAPGSMTALLDLGIALSHTLDREDADNEVMGEQWVSSGRPLIFAAIQWVLCFLLIILPSLAIERVPLWATLTVFCVVTVLVGLFSYRVVREKWRMGLTRFAQYTNVLHSGLQFIVPLIEEDLPFPIQNFIWGQPADDDDSSYLHLPAWGPEKKKPGIITVTLGGRYKVDLRIKVMIRVRRSSPEDWYRFLFEFTDLEEISEQIGDITETVAATLIREVEADFQGKDQKDPELIAKMLQAFMNRIPEVAGPILLALFEVSRERLGGLLPISVSMLNPNPDENFQQQLRKLDTAKIHRATEELDGEARQKRWGKLIETTMESLEKYKTPEELKLIGEILRRDVQLELASSPTGVDALVQSLALKALDSATGSDKKPNKETVT